MKMKARKDYLLANGISIPAIGFGTWQIPDGEAAYNATIQAVEAGYRHLDTAAAYQNEPSIGKAIRDLGLRREEIFVTSKLKADKNGFDTTMNEFYLTLERLGLSYLDLYLIHWPKPFGTEGNGEEYFQKNVESWKAMIKLHKEGKIRAIGVSNFKPLHLDPLIEQTGFHPHVNQISLCPGNMQEETVSYCKERGTLLEAYSPLATGRLFKVDKIHLLADKYHKSPAQIAIRWSLERGFLPLPKSTTPSRIAENIDVYDFELAFEDLLILDKLEVPPKPKKA